MSFNPDTYKWASCVPELLVSNVNRSLAFYRDVLGFEIMYGRPEVGFYYLDYQGAQIMLEQRNGNWETGAMEKPFGRGVNFQIHSSDIDTLLAALKKAKWFLYLDDHTKWYKAGDKAETGLRQFLVQDPDGYLLRFSQRLGSRPLA